jgi:alkanesulfonate monooxygenase SsuD/methylene tetrahydromethanopterin reductase-like flavin-dependent oxidoreductase (luciferase family)
MKVGVLLPLADEDYLDGTPSYAEIRGFALAAEALGLDSIWAVDHVLFRFDGETTGVQECWTMAAALAEATERVEIGTLVVCTEFRNPALLAKMAAGLDDVSGGRLILGLGAGWHDPEYEAFGYPTDRKVSRFAESLEIVEGLLHQGRSDLAGTYHQTRDCVLLPPPAREVPLLVGAKRPRMLELTARHADAWNTAWYGLPDARLREMHARLQAACEQVGRTEPMTITHGIHVHYPDLHASLEDRDAIVGTPDEVAAGLAAHAEAGADHVIVWLVPSTLEALGRLGETVQLFHERTPPA